MAFVAVASTAYVSGHALWGELFNLALLALLIGSLVAAIASRDTASRVFYSAFLATTTFYIFDFFHGLTGIPGIERLPMIVWINVGASHFYRSPVGPQFIAIVIGTLVAYLSRAIYVLNERRSKRSVEEP
jgi:hypothetical protein